MREINGTELAVFPKNVSDKVQPQHTEQLSPWRLGSKSETERKDLLTSGNDADVLERPTGLSSST